MFISITKSTENTEYLEGTPLLITKKINYEKKVLVNAEKLLHVHNTE